MSDLYNDLLRDILLVSNQNPASLVNQSTLIGDLYYINREKTYRLSKIILEYVKKELDSSLRYNGSVLTILDGCRVYNKVLESVNNLNTFLEQNYSLTIDMGVIDGLEDDILVYIFKHYVDVSNVGTLQVLSSIINRRIDELTSRNNF